MRPDDLSRRSFVRACALALAGIAAGVRSLRGERAPATAAAAGDDIPEAVRKVLRARFGDRPPREGHVQLDVPEVAPDSREVPVFIETDLPMEPARWVKAIHLVVDHNPDIYLAGFTLSPALGAASIDTRIKMRRSSQVRAIVETSTGELWMASKLVYTTLNGCV
ncbi:MAG TPA: thiosulfate oxidation carrier protein SoxY [Gemmatimonadaceae bacterium]|nr:thiosulfate oxidation carrier protein SoxY [Gemmatimonadaceae bacterium]